MVALTESPSLVELGARKLAAVGTDRRARKAQRDRPATPAVTRQVALDIMGTLVALVFFVTAAFLVGQVVGFAVAGVAMLLLDFKVSVSRRAAHAKLRR